MTKSLILAPLAILAFLSTSSPAEMKRGGASVQQPTAPQALLGDSDEGVAVGTVVIWNHFTSGLPTGHAQGRLLDGNRVVAQFQVRLEDDGDVTGTAQTVNGPPEDVDGRWEFDDGDGEFEVELEFDGFEFEIEGEFEGRRSFWQGEWELEPND